MQVTSKTGKQITITAGGPWRLYQHAPPPGWAVLALVAVAAIVGVVKLAKKGDE